MQLVINPLYPGGRRNYNGSRRTKTMKRYRMLIGAAVIVALALAAYFSGLYRQPEEPENQTPAKVTLE